MVDELGIMGKVDELTNGTRAMQKPVSKFKHAATCSLVRLLCSLRNNGLGGQKV